MIGCQRDHRLYDGSQLSLSLSLTHTHTHTHRLSIYIPSGQMHCAVLIFRGGGGGGGEVRRHLARSPINQSDGKLSIKESLVPDPVPHDPSLGDNP